MILDKSRRKWIVVLAGILYFVGVASILYPSFSNLLSLMTAETVISSYQQGIEETTKEDLSEIFKLADSYNQAIADLNYNAPNAHCLDRGGGIMCYLEIPSISVYLPVYYGTSDSVLEKGCGHLENTSLPVGGKNTHSVISGHTGLPSAQMFTNLDLVNLNEVFYIHVLDRVLAYSVTDIKVVEPTDVSDLYVVEGEDLVTLLTCTPYGINDHRLLVRGTRIPYDPSSPDEVTPTSAQLRNAVNDGMDDVIFSQLMSIVATGIAAILIFIIACIWIVADNVHIKAQESGKPTPRWAMVFVTIENALQALVNQLKYEFTDIDP